MKWHLLLYALLLSCALSACRTSKTSESSKVVREVPVTIEKVMHDTLRIVNERIDSIYLHDSVWMERVEKADTVYITKNVYKTEYRDRMVYKDTGSVHFDSVEVPVEIHDTIQSQTTVTEYKARPITKALATVGLACIIAMGAYIGIKIYKVFKV